MKKPYKILIVIGCIFLACYSLCRELPVWYHIALGLSSVLIATAIITEDL